MGVDFFYKDITYINILLLFIIDKTINIDKTKSYCIVN